MEQLPGTNLAPSGVFSKVSEHDQYHQNLASIIEGTRMHQMRTAR
jgi:hypothetical protein